MIVLCANRLLTPQEEIKNALVFIEDGHISAVSSRNQQEIPKSATIVDLGDATLAPGFVDIHMHGGAGLDVMRASLAELPHLNRFLTTHGVTGYFPTTVAAPLDQTCVALERLAGAIEAAQGPQTVKDGEVQALPLGIHLEGPFLSHKRRGVHPPEYLAEPTLPIFERLWQAARGHVRMMTIAPELPGAIEVITDATAAAGMPDGMYQLGPIQVEVKNGKCTMGGKLAGSVLTMDRAVRNVTRFAGWSLQDAVRAATLNPARAAGLAQGHGALAP